MAIQQPPIVLLNGVTSDFVGTPVSIATGEGRGHDALWGVYVYSTDFGGGTVTIQVSPDGVNWFIALSINDNQAVFVGSPGGGGYLLLNIIGLEVRAKLENSASAAAVTVKLVRGVRQGMV